MVQLVEWQELTLEKPLYHRGVFRLENKVQWIVLPSASSCCVQTVLYSGRDGPRQCKPESRYLLGISNADNRTVGELLN